MNGRSMDAIRNDCSFIFPPINHENLQIPSNHQKQTHPDHDDHLKPGPPLPSPSHSRLPIKWLSIGFDVLRAKVFSINGGIRGTFWSFLPATGMVVTVMLWWLLRRVKRRGGMSVDRLMVVIKERDEKIIQLLHQIVQMNEVLLAHHKVSASKLAN